MSEEKDKQNKVTGVAFDIDPTPPPADQMPTEQHQQQRAQNQTQTPWRPPVDDLPASADKAAPSPTDTATAPAGPEGGVVQLNGSINGLGLPDWLTALLGSADGVGLADDKAYDTRLPWDERRKHYIEHNPKEAQFLQGANERIWETAQKKAEVISRALNGHPQEEVIMLAGVLLGMIATVRHRCPQCVAESLLYWGQRWLDEQGQAYSDGTGTKKPVTPSSLDDLI